MKYIVLAVVALCAFAYADDFLDADPAQKGQAVYPYGVGQGAYPYYGNPYYGYGGYGGYYGYPFNYYSYPNYYNYGYYPYGAAAAVPYYSVARYEYQGEYPEKCTADGFYHRDAESFVICSNGNAFVQRCAPGSRSSGVGNLVNGKHYSHSEFCDVNLVDQGYNGA